MNKRKSFARIFLYLALFFLIWALRATVFYFVDTSIESTALRNVYSNAIKFIVWVLPVFLYLICLNRENPLVKLKLITAARKQTFLRAGFVIIIYFVGLISFEFITSGKTLMPLFRASFYEIVQALAVVFVSPIFEEIMFRGFVLNELREKLSFWQANVLTSLLFVLAHYPNWLWVNGFQPWIITISLSILILSLFLGWLVKETDSLYPSIIAHLVNNFIVNFLRN